MAITLSRLQTQGSNMSDSPRHFVFLLTSSRHGGNTEWLARKAAESLPSGATTEWIDLLETPLPPFRDIRHAEGDGTYPEPTGNALSIFHSTLAATDLVFVAPLYWYSVPTNAKLYLDHWSGWMRVSNYSFKASMAEKTVWAVSALSDPDRTMAEPLVGTLKLSAQYFGGRYGGTLFGFGNKPGDVMNDHDAIESARTFFR
jgi:multimeric flavodoxin WrbA